MNSSLEMIFLVETPCPCAGVLQINAGSAALSTAQTDGRLPALWFEVKCLGWRLLLFAVMPLSLMVFVKDLNSKKDEHISASLIIVSQLGPLACAFSQNPAY